MVPMQHGQIPILVGYESHSPAMSFTGPITEEKAYQANPGGYPPLRIVRG